MKRTTYIISIFGALAMLLSACSDFLDREPWDSVDTSEGFQTAEDAVAAVNAAYQPLQWAKLYNMRIWTLDIMAGNSVVGAGGGTDGIETVDLANFIATADNFAALDLWRGPSPGILRCNFVLQNVPGMDMDQTLKNRCLGEAYFLRAYYYFRLVRVFGGVPKVDFIIDSSEKWQQPRASVADIYQLIVSDLEEAQKRLWKKSEYADEDLGRATKGAAQAMLLKVNLYMASDGLRTEIGGNAADYYRAAKAWGDSIISSQEYDLCPDYADNFTLDGENGIESVFEIQYMTDQTSDYGEGYGFTRGTFTNIMTRSRSSQLGGGWGFNHPTQNLYDEYEANDTRRDVAIFNPTDEQMDTPEEEIYLGSRYLNRKTMWINKDGSLPNIDHATRGPLNNKQIRYADVLLMYAEACLGLGDEGTATTYLNQVRQRPSVNLSTYPGYSISINGTTIASPTLEQAIRHERRMELAMEGHRWFDICRWGIAKETMDAYKATESEEAQSHMAEFIKGKHELLPIPSQERELNDMPQNPGY